MSFWRKPEPKSNGTVLFLFIGLVMTLVLAGVVVSKSMMGGTAEVTGQDGARRGKTGQDALGALPEDASDVVGPFEVSASTEPTLVFGYLRGSDARLALVQRDRKTGGYVLRSEIAMSSSPNGFASVAALAEGPKWGISPVIAVRGPSLSDSGIESVAFVAVYGTDLAQVTFVAGDGTMPAEFAEGESGAASWDVREEDVTGDGVSEVLHRERYRLGEVETEETRAYVWDCGRLAFDERLSWAMTVRGGLFPEPEE